MNAAHLHLATNHIPVIGVPIALILLAYGVYSKNERMTDFGLALVLVLALFTAPAYFSGHEAEELVENLPGISESLIETHEEASKLSLAGMIVAGFSAGIALVFRSRRTLQAGIAKALLAILAISAVSLTLTANLGGRIRHPEIRPDFVAPKGEGGHEH